MSGGDSYDSPSCVVKQDFKSSDRHQLLAPVNFLPNNSQGEIRLEWTTEISKRELSVKESKSPAFTAFLHHLLIFFPPRSLCSQESNTLNYLKCITLTWERKCRVTGYVELRYCRVIIIAKSTSPSSNSLNPSLKTLS